MNLPNIPIEQYQVEELQNEVGNECSDNHSSTLRSVLISVNETRSGWVCKLKEVSANGKPAKLGVRSMPAWIVSNMFFGR